MTPDQADRGSYLTLVTRPGEGFHLMDIQRLPVLRTGGRTAP